MGLEETNSKWFAVQVRPKYEFITASVLRNKGYEDFVPSYKSVRRWSDRRKEITAPLFTGYVFCKCNAEIFGPVVTTPGVIRIVGTKNRIAPIEESEIEAIRKAVSFGNRVCPYPYLSIGNRVYIKEGPMAGIEGILISIGNQHRLILSVDLVQNSIAVEVNASAVTKVADGPIRSRAVQLEQRSMSKDESTPALPAAADAAQAAIAGTQTAIGRPSGPMI